MISVIIITLNEEDNIRRCLESVKWADEIIIVDSGSTDKTKTICSEYTDNFFERAWTGFGDQKNFALSKATKSWILSIDADEEVTMDLQEEIRNKITNNQDIMGYRIPRLTNFFGKFIRYSGWYPDYVLRLARREKTSFSNDLVHEKMITDGPIKKISNHLLHYSFKDISTQIDKVQTYSSSSALMMFKANKKISWFSVFLKTFFSFVKPFILRFGFLDGVHGLLIAVFSSINTFLKYAKLKELISHSKKV